MALDLLRGYNDSAYYQTLSSEEQALIQKIDVKRAWKDPQYRMSLSSEEYALLPTNPMQPEELSEEEVRVLGRQVAGKYHPDPALNWDERSRYRIDLSGSN